MLVEGLQESLQKAIATALDSFVQSHRGPQGERGPTGAASNIPGPAGPPADLTAAIEAAKEQMSFELERLTSYLQETMPKAAMAALKQVGVINADGTISANLRGAQGAPGKDGASIVGPSGVNGANGTDGTNGRDAVVRIGTVSSGDIARVTQRQDVDGATIFDFVFPRGERGADGVGIVGPVGPAGASVKGEPGRDADEAAVRTAVEISLRRVIKGDIANAIRAFREELRSGDK